MTSINRTFTAKHKDMQSRLKSHWDRAKSQCKSVKQKTAENHIGIRQATISMYLNGQLALNTEIILKFVTFLNDQGYEIRPEDIDPELNGLINYKAKVFVLSTDDRKRPSLDYVISGKAEDHTVYGIELRKTGKIVIVSPVEKPRKNSQVCVNTSTGYVIGKLKEQTDEEVLLDSQTLPQSKVITVHKIVETFSI